MTPSSRFSLDGVVAVVTGARGKLGPVWVAALADAGARVAALDLPGAAGSANWARVDQSSGRIASYDCDITRRDDLEEACARLTRDLGAPAVLVNNAGVDQPPDTGGARAEVQDISADVFRRMVDVNLVGTFQATQVFGAAMLEAGRGSIINIGSLYASVSPDQRFYDHFPGTPPFLKGPAYGASKAGVVSLTKFFATLWGPRGIRVNTLSPGGVSAGQDAEFVRKYSSRVPLARMAVDADLAGPLVFLASDASSYVTGSELRIDGGFTAW